MTSTSSLLIAQLSDLHVRPAGHLYQKVVDSNRMLTEAIDHLHGLDRRPDVVVLSGDLTDHGHAAEYAALTGRLSALTIPYLVMPGNHDERSNLRAAFRDHLYLPPDGPLHWCVDDWPVRIIGLDTTVPGQHHGDIEPEGIHWLRETLASAPDKPTLIVMHHPPFRCGIAYMDEYRYMRPEPLADVIARFDNVELIACGHVHRAMIRRWAGSVVATAPSTTTEIALQLDPEAPPQSFVGPRGCMLHLWTAGAGIVSHYSQIGRFEGPYAFG